MGLKSEVRGLLLPLVAKFEKKKRPLTLISYASLALARPLTLISYRSLALARPLTIFSYIGFINNAHLENPGFIPTVHTPTEVL